MKTQMNEPITDYDGTVITQRDANGKDIPLTWKDISVKALNTISGDDRLSSDDIAKCYVITVKLYDNETPDLTDNERMFIKERIKKFYTQPLLHGKAEEFFESKPAVEKTPKEAI